MSQIKPCPRCQTPLQIPEPTPEQVRCPRCGAVIKHKAVPAEVPVAAVASEAAVTPARVPPRPPAAATDETRKPGLLRSNLFLLRLLAGVISFGLLATLGVALALWFAEREKDLPKKEGPLAKAEPKETKKLSEIMPIKEIKATPKAAPVQPSPPSPKVQSAIGRGVEFLKKKMPVNAPASNEMSVGTAALAGLALLEAKVSPGDAAIQTALVGLRDNGPTLEHGYVLSTALLFLNQLNALQPLQTSDLELHRSLTLRLIAGQDPEGLWTYSNPPLTKEAENVLLQQLRANTYKPNKSSPLSRPDNSVTQFALLALWGSRNSRVPVRPALLPAVTRFHHTQSPDGAWGYLPSAQIREHSDSNTCAGLVALAIENFLREDKGFQGPSSNDPPNDAELGKRHDKAFAYLAKTLTRLRDGSPKKNSASGNIIGADAYGDYYFLWCLERVAMIYDLTMIGDVDWYHWGSEIIVKNQRPDGSWFDGNGDVPDTSFALLYLTRANLAKDLTENIRRRRK